MSEDDVRSLSKNMLWCHLDQRSDKKVLNGLFSLLLLLKRSSWRIRVLMKEALGWNIEEQTRIMVLRLQERTTSLSGMGKGSKRP